MSQKAKARKRRPYVRLPSDVMHELVQKGLTNIEIIEILKRDHGVDSLSPSITRWKERHGYEVKKSTPERLALVPWRVPEKDATNRVFRGLQAEAARRAGKKLSDSIAASLAKLKNELAGQTGQVIHYDRTNGWVLVPRRAGIDKDMIRDPRIADDGTPIEDRNLWQ